MRKLLEIDINENQRKTLVTRYALSFLTFAMFFLVRSVELSFFEASFFVELIFLVMLFRFYSRAHKNKNYAYWGLALVIALYLSLHILHFTFIDYNIFVLYIAFLAATFLGVNTYVMSSPLYYPRIQWWEYDFRYRGEFKATATVNGLSSDVRLADLRRDCASILAFDHLPLGSDLTLEIPYGKKLYEVSGNVRTLREVIPGRPIRYGIVLKLDTQSEKETHLKLKKVWDMHKKANLRRKFADYQESETNED